MIPATVGLLQLWDRGAGAEAPPPAMPAPIREPWSHVEDRAVGRISWRRAGAIW